MDDSLNFCIKNFPKTRAVTKRFVGPYAECKPAWDIISQWAKERDLIDEHTVFFGMAHDDPEQVKECRYDACLSVPDHVEIEDTDEITIQEIAEQPCIMTTHKGPYEALFDTYTQIYSGEPSKKHQLDYTKPCFEIYKNCPESTPADELLTDVYVPIEN